MGYYTLFKVQVSHDKGPEYLDEITIYGQKLTPDCNNNYSMEFDAKWYDYIEDMQEFSQKFPDLVFIVDGDGEEEGDNWRRFFKAGHSYQCRIDLREVRNGIKFDQSKIDQESMDKALS